MQKQGISTIYKYLKLYQVKARGMYHRYNALKIGKQSGLKTNQRIVHGYYKDCYVVLSFILYDS